MNKSIIVILLLLVQLSFLAQDEDITPKYSNEFLNIGVGARALGMSNSVIASTDDVTSGYWNPTGLLNIDSDLQIGLMHSEYFAGIAKYDYGAIAKKIDDQSAMAFSFIRFGVDNIPNTTELIDAQGNIDYDRITYFSAADMAFMFSYARKINDKLNVGGSGKIIHRKVGDFAKSWGFGIDFAATYKLGNWKIAALSRDITTTFNAWSFSLTDQMIETFDRTDNEIPENGLEITMPRIILAGMRQWKIGNSFTYLAELDADFTTDGKRNVMVVGDPISIDPHFGMELGFKNIVFVRAGLGNLQKVTEITGKEVVTVQPNIGIGVKLKGISLDYALTDIGDASVALYSNVFSLRFNLNKNN